MNYWLNYDYTGNVSTAPKNKHAETKKYLLWAKN